jgi:hypothetical protein
MSSKFSSLSTGRPSVTSSAKAKLMESLKDEVPAEATRRVNFEVTKSKHAKLKINAAKNGQSIKEFLTAYIDTLPDE